MSESKTVYEWGTERGLTPQAEILRLRAENARMRERLSWIYECSSNSLSKTPQLPKRVDEMTTDEFMIYSTMTYPFGALLSIQDWAEEGLRKEA